MAADQLLIPLAAGGVALYYVSKKGDDGEPGEIQMPPMVITRQPATDSGLPAAVVITKTLPKVNTANNSGLFQKPATGLLDSIGLSQFKDQMETELTAAAKTKYDELSSAAKKAGAEALNKQLKLNPPLTGNESFKQVASRTGAAVGGTVGTAACAAYPATAAAAPLCGMVGAYLGEKLGPAVGKYTKKATKAVTGAAKKVGSTVKKGIKKLKFW
jgi:hypothetical protein